MLLHLLRHGESTWNVEGRVQGQAMDVELTPTGVRQAGEAAQAMRDLDLLAVLSSDQTRAMRTAEIVSRPHGLTPVPHAWLREQDTGEFTGRLSSELRPEPVPDGLDISEIRWGGGESILDVYRRMTQGLEWLRGHYPADAELALVGHADSLRVLLAVIDGRTHREVEWSPLGHCQPVTRTI